MIIYKLTNKINGKAYVGQTKFSIEQRITEHSKYGDSYISRAIKKYGLQSFDISVIDIASDKEILNEKEEYWISYYNTVYPNGYNLTSGGNGVVNLPEHIRKKCGDHCRGKKNLKHSIWLKEFYKDPEIKEKHRKATKEGMNKIRVVEKISESAKRMWQDLDFKSKRSQVVKDKWKEPGYRERQIKSHQHKKKTKVD